MSVRLRLPIRLPELVADDRALLGRFVEAHDDEAFAAIVKRHGSMVLGVCRRAVRDAHLAEDAFQAVFLVLSRNPQAAVRANSVAGWLFGIARRVGLAARRHEVRREKRERRIIAPRQSDPIHEWDDLLRTVDEELAKIPGEERAALIACFLREQTHDEAARELGWSLSTLRRRLERGKELLRARLTRRGATLSAGLFAGVLAPSTAAALPRTLAASAGNPTAASALATNLAAKALGGVAAKVVPAILALVTVVGIAAAFARPETPVADAPGSPVSITETHPVAPVSAPPRDWVTVTGQVLFPEARELPERREILKTDNFVKDAECCFADGRRLFFENLIIEPKTRGIANAVVWLRQDKEDPKFPFPPEKIHPKFADAKSKEHAIDVVDCQFHPRITVARVGDTLLFENRTPVAVNVKYDAEDKGPGTKFFGFNMMLAAKIGTMQPRESLEWGTQPDAVSSNIHPWMKGYVWAFDHPYATVTDANGKFSIPNAPVGEHLCRLVIWHEEFGYGPGGKSGVPVKITDGPAGAMDLGPKFLEGKPPE